MQYETLEFLSGHIICPRWKMFNLLKKLRSPSVFSKDEVCMIINKLVHMPTNNLDNVMEEKDYLKKSIEWMIRMRLNNFIGLEKDRWTRSNSMVSDKLFNVLKKERIKIKTRMCM